MIVFEQTNRLSALKQKTFWGVDDAGLTTATLSRPQTGHQFYYGN